MRVRTQLVVAFLVLAVVPLAAIVLYSYWTSQRAIRQAVSAESAHLAAEMSLRLDVVRDDIEERLKRVANLPVRSLFEGGESGDQAGKVYTDLMSRMGDLSETVDWFEFTPVEDRGSDSEPFLIYPSVTLTKALERLRRQALSLEEAGVSREYLESLVQEAIKSRERLEASELEAVEARGAQVERLLGSEFTSPVRRGEEIIGHLTAMVPASQVLRQVMAATPRGEGEIPFARGADGEIYVQYPEERELLRDIGISEPNRESTATDSLSLDWIVAESADSETGLVLGVARPITDPLREIRRTAFNNMAYGLVLVVLAMVGILWLSRRMTINLTQLTEGAERLAAGDLSARVSIATRDEFGLLGSTFNRMAEQIDEERRRKEEEIQRRLVEAENERRSREFEEARQLQLSLLPRHVPELPDLEIGTFMRTAAEVGGDYYDFFPSERHELVAAIGDAAGHGLRAGTMVSVVKGFLTSATMDAELAALLGRSSRSLRRMQLGRMNMALSLVRLAQGKISIASAGMPPALVWRANSGAVEEVVLPGTPLGGMADTSYLEWSSKLDRGDTVLLMTDGFPELLDRTGEPLGYHRVRSIFSASVQPSAKAIIKNLSRQAEKWSAGRPPQDDITFLVLRMRSEGSDAAQDPASDAPSELP
ncbi:MAG: SpoIIE family protein phosphatase [Acidobacteriota bacterium]